MNTAKPPLGLLQSQYCMVVAWLLHPLFENHVKYLMGHNLTLKIFFLTIADAFKTDLHWFAYTSEF